MLEHNVARLGQSNLITLTLKEQHVVLFFLGADMACDRRLGDIELLGSLAKGQILGCGVKHFQAKIWHRITSAAMMGPRAKLVIIRTSDLGLIKVYRYLGSGAH